MIKMINDNVITLSDKSNVSVVNAFVTKTFNDANCDKIIQGCCVSCHICNEMALSCQFASKTQLTRAYDYSSQYVAAMAVDASASCESLRLMKVKTSEYDSIYSNNTHHITACKYCFSKEKNVSSLYLMQCVENSRARANLITNIIDAKHKPADDHNSDFKLRYDHTSSTSTNNTPLSDDHSTNNIRNCITHNSCLPQVFIMFLHYSMPNTA